MIPRWLAHAQDALTLCVTITGTLLVLHIADRIAFGLALKGVLS